MFILFAMATRVCRLCKKTISAKKAVSLFGTSGVKDRLAARISVLLDLFPLHICESCKSKISFLEKAVVQLDRFRNLAKSSLESRGLESRGLESRGLEGRGLEGRGLEGRGLESRGLEGRGLEGRGLEGRGLGLESRGLESRGLEGRGLEGRGLEGRGLEGRGLESRGLEGRGLESRGLEGRGLESKGLESRGLEGRDLQGRGLESRSLKRTKETSGEVGVSPDTTRQRPCSKQARRKLTFGTSPKVPLQHDTLCVVAPVTRPAVPPSEDVSQICATVSEDGIDVEVGVGVSEVEVGVSRVGGSVVQGEDIPDSSEVQVPVLQLETGGTEGRSVSSKAVTVSGEGQLQITSRGYMNPGMILHEKIRLAGSFEARARV